MFIHEIINRKMLTRTKHNLHFEINFIVRPRVIEQYKQLPQFFYYLLMLLIVDMPAIKYKVSA